MHLLVYSKNRRLSGDLELTAPDGRTGTIQLWRGRIAGARTTPPVAYFGTVAYELGWIDTATHDATLLEIAQSKALHGEVLIRRGALTPAQRDDILAEQACRKIHTLFTFPPESVFTFFERAPTVDEPPLSMDLMRPTWRGLRDTAPMVAVRMVLDRYAALHLRLTNEGPITNAGFNGEEIAVCENLLSRPMTLAQVRVASRLPTNHVDLLVYLLLITKCAEPVAAPAVAVPVAPGSSPTLPPSSERGVPAAPPSSQRLPQVPRIPESQRMPAAARSFSPPPLSSQPRISHAPGSGEMRASMSFRVPSAPSMQVTSPSPRPAAVQAPVFGPADLGPSGIAHRASTIENEDFFEVLGIAEGASVEAARAAYFRLAKLWHPDRLPADLEPFRGEVAKVFAQMTRASATLTDGDSYKSYLATRDRDAGKKNIAQKPRGEAIRDIETSIGKREFSVAEQNARHLVDADRDDADAMALAAWALVQAGEATEDVLRATLPQLDKAVHTDTYCERAHFYRGIIHKRLGNGAAAFRDFTRVTQINPRHVDAQREIRIMEMRARKGSGEHALDLKQLKKKK
ncbi:MAG: DnaJ-class molecular chaperone CbpA [Labilithrix sp.]|nr:DnaJ-class molecular chaperone CbpA [Labilithrix sp.]